MSSPTVRVTGLRELSRQLKRLEGDAGDLKAANSAAAALVAARAASLAPKRTGRLASTVKGNRAVGRATVRAGRASVPYAGPIHYGWPARGITGRPFVIDAAEQTESAWLPLYERAIAQAVDKVS